MIIIGKKNKEKGKRKMRTNVTKWVVDSLAYTNFPIQQNNNGVIGILELTRNLEYLIYQ